MTEKDEETDTPSATDSEQSTEYYASDRGHWMRVLHGDTEELQEDDS